MNRRELLQLAGVTATSAFLYSPGSCQAEEKAQTSPPAVPLADRLCLFTDHLDDAGYSYAEVAAMLSPLKISGPDLTLRPGGIVAPERVAEDLPKAAAAFRDKGMSVPMVSTNLTSAKDPTAQPILTTMGKLGIGYFKLGYYHYHELARWESELETQRKDLAALLDLTRKAGVHAGFHNHSGATIGGAIWDSWEFLRPLDPASVGFYFDPAHATIEGYRHTWKLNLRRISQRLTMVALKDFVFEKGSKGWQTRWCPLGEGMVNWDEFFALLVQLPFPGPISIHIEYDPGGNTRVERIDKALAAAQKDIAFVRKHLAAHKK